MPTPLHSPRRYRAMAGTVLAALALTGLAACGGGSKGSAGGGANTGQSTTAASGASADSSSTTSSSGASTNSSSTSSQQPSAADTLSKADFITQTNALCTSMSAKVDKLPEPSSDTDYTGMLKYASGVLELFPSYISQVRALVDRSPDKATLTAKWVAVEEGDFQSFKPAAERLVADIQANNTSKVAADVEALGNASDHSSQLAAFMTQYGLTSCAAFESS